MNIKRNPIKYIRSYGIRLYVIQIIILVLNKGNIFSGFNDKLKIKKNRMIENYLSTKYKDIIDKYKNKKVKYDKYSNTIWVLWYQGLDKAPDVVRKCIKSISKYCKDKDIIVLTEENIGEYIEIPKYIDDKVNERKISITHLSDIIRMNVLKKYGGFWVDATIYLTGNPFKGEEFTTVKFLNENKTIISNCLWCSFFFGGKNQLFYDFMVDFYLEYWKNEDLIIDYFLLDYIIKLAYDNVDKIKETFDKVPYNNKEIHRLESLLNDKYDERVFKGIKKENCVHKLSYKNGINIDDLDNYYNKL